MTTTPSGVMVVPAPRFADVLAADLEGRVLPALVIESGVEVDLAALDLEDLDEQEPSPAPPTAVPSIAADEPDSPRAAVLPLIAAASVAAQPDGNGQEVAAQLLMSVVGDFARSALASSSNLVDAVPDLRRLTALLDEIDVLTSNGIGPIAAGGRAT